MTDKWLISKLLKNSKSKIIQSKQGAEDLNRHLSKDIQTANKHMKKILNITIREMQIKSTMRLSPYTDKNVYHQREYRASLVTQW